MKIVKFFAIALCLHLAVWAQETTIPPAQVRGVAAPVIVLFAWDTTGRPIPLRIGNNLTVSLVGGFWQLDAAPSAPIAPPERFKFTATVGQTVFTINPAGITKDVWVYRNGILQGEPGDYSISVDWKTITMAVPAIAGDWLQIFAVK
jgi:hypothetical protein